MTWKELKGLLRIVGTWILVVMGLVAFLSAVFISVDWFIDYTTGQSKADRYCENILDEDSYGSIGGIEQGYIKCCKDIYVDHEKQPACIIQPYTR